MKLADRDLLALLGPGHTWHRWQNRDSYSCDHCNSVITGPLIVGLRRFLSSRG